MTLTPTDSGEFTPRYKECFSCHESFLGTRKERLCARCETKANVEWDSKEERKVKPTVPSIVEPLPPVEESETSGAKQGEQPSIGGCVSRPAEFDPAHHPSPEMVLDLPMQHGHPRFYEILDDLANLHSQKAQAYEGKSGYYANYRRFNKWAPVIAKHPHLAGFCYSMLRLEEKLERVRNVLEGSLAGDEPITEDLDDMAVISVIGRVLYEESNNGKDKV